MHQSPANAARDDDKRSWLWREGRRSYIAQTWRGDILHEHGMTVHILFIVLYIMHKYSILTLVHTGVGFHFRERIQLLRDYE